MRQLSGRVSGLGSGQLGRAGSGMGSGQLPPPGSGTFSPPMRTASSGMQPAAAPEGVVRLSIGKQQMMVLQTICKDTKCKLLLLDMLADATARSAPVCLRCWTYAQAEDVLAQEITRTVPPWMRAAEASRQLMTHLRALLLLLL